MKKSLAILLGAAVSMPMAQVNLAQMLFGSAGGAKTSFGFGPAKLDSVDEISYQFSLGKQWPAIPNADIRLSGDFVVSPEGNKTILSAGLGLNYYFNQNNATPYFTGTFGFGSDFKQTQGFNLYGGLGVMLFRGAKAQLFLEPNVQMILQKQYPKSIGLKFGLVI